MEWDFKEPLPFSMDEYESRVNRAKEEMDKQGLDTLILFKPENYYYLTGHRGAAYDDYVCLIFPREKEPIFVMSLLEVDCAKVLSTVTRIEPYSVFAEPPKNEPVPHLVSVLKGEGFDKGTIGVELNAWWQTPLQYEQLREGLPHTRFQDCTFLVDGLRAIKSEAELNYMRAAGKILTKAMYAAINAVGEDISENEVVWRIMDSLLVEGCDPGCFLPLVSSGYRTALTHNTWSDRRMKRGEPVFIEFAGVVKQYHTPMMRTVAVGEVTDEVKGIMDVVIEALNRGIEAVKPGVTSGEVDEAVRGTIKKRGWYDYFLHRTAYSVGIGFVATWASPPGIKEKDPTILQPGMTFHMVPTLNRYHMGIGLSEPIAVTETGCELLANVERKLFVK
jgi:Xaa-Pro dipeptidase